MNDISYILVSNNNTNNSVTEFLELGLSKAIKYNDGIYSVGYDLIPGTYRVELTD